MRVSNHTLPNFFQKRDGISLCEGYKLLMYANSVHEPEKSGRDIQKEEWKDIILQVDEWKGTGCKCQ